MLKSLTEVKWIKGAHSLLLLVIFATYGIPASPMLRSPVIEASLQQQINDSPISSLNVIVQKSIKDNSVEEYVAKLGGEVTKDLTIINALAATLPAFRIAELAQHSGVRWISPDAKVEEQGCKECIRTNKLKNDYIMSVRADQVWNQVPYLQGKGVTIAVVDSGIASNHPDLKGRVIAEKNLRLIPSTYDYFGHGTYVAGVIAGNGSASKGRYIGIAPQANLLNVKVSGSLGASYESDVVAGLQWIYENRAKYNIRVVNISINSTTAQSYHTSPLDAACEILWFNGIVVVVSSGNRGENAVYPPANDPFVITVGATDSNGTPVTDDDTVAPFSAFGTTADGISKPEIVAPGRHIVAPLSNPSAQLALLHPSNVVNEKYLLMSGTSVAAPVVSGAVALLLEDEPNLTPDQVKYRLLATANTNWRAYNATTAGAGYLDIKAAIQGETTENANTDMHVSNLLTTGSDGILAPHVTWGSVSWNSVSWNSVSWNSVSWNSVSWNSVSWNSDYWDSSEVINNIKSLRSLSFDLDKGLDETDEQDLNEAKIFLPIISSSSN